MHWLSLWKYHEHATDTALQEQCYDNLRISKNAWDTNLIKVHSLTHPPTRRVRRPSSACLNERTGEPRIHLGELGGERRRRLRRHPH
ncbi:MAG: DUF1899 domain-containing protein [Terriglobus roseus]|nr:DUF1899 domain-containing protein [Terriglobus roseus]